ncbi:MAG: sulfotransferase [Actinobacteria bacterium]|nr:sulfotransferase [Actinomycetota bacterium]
MSVRVLVPSPVGADTMANGAPAGLPRRTPRPWHGMTMPVWLRLLVRNHFAVSPSRIPMALAVSVFSVLNSSAAVVQRIRFGRAVSRTRIEIPPLFIVGHWRTGTTLLHELLALDDRFAYPTTYQCMAPRHFLVTRRMMTRLGGLLLPEHRPIDGMRLRWDLPQEDEFALCVQGLPSLYAGWAFPRRGGDGPTLDPAEMPGEEGRRWRAALLGFLQAVTLGDGRRLVLKSPAHTARAATLAEMFPGASFVHMVRDPYVVVPSALEAWRRMADSLGLQTGCRPDLEDHLMGVFEAMYRRFEEDRKRIGPGRVVDVRYEDLVADPVAVMARIYQSLGLGGFEGVRPAIEGYVEAAAGYLTNRHESTPGLRRRITERWAGYARRYGYELDDPQAVPVAPTA